MQPHIPVIVTASDRSLGSTINQSAGLFTLAYGQINNMATMPKEFEAKGKYFFQAAMPLPWGLNRMPHFMVYIKHNYWDCIICLTGHMIYMSHNLRLHDSYMFANPRSKVQYRDIIWDHDKPLITKPSILSLSPYIFYHHPTSLVSVCWICVSVSVCLSVCLGCVDFGSMLISLQLFNSFLHT